MAKEITYRLDYVEAGKPAIKHIRINFISNGMRRDYFKIESDIEQGIILSNTYKLKLAEYERLTAAGEDTTKLMEEFLDIKSKLESILDGDGSDAFEKRRIDLVIKILIGNGFSKSDKFTQHEFWFDCVDIETINEMLAVAINKDISRVTKRSAEGARVSG